MRSDARRFVRPLLVLVAVAHRFETALCRIALPAFAIWFTAIATSAQATDAVTAVEYYYPAWNYYFETAFPDEIAGLDGGAYGGVWKRTGETFNVWPQPSNALASPTCRFFSTTFAPKSSHFYTPYPAECDFVKTTNPNWEFESIAFYIALVDGAGNCPAGTIPLYRFYNNGMGGAPNHRYTTSLVVSNQMAALGWQFEGNANTKVFACVPSNPIGRYPLAARGIYAFFDRRGWASGYYSGDVIHLFGQLDQDLQNGFDNERPYRGVMASPTVGAEVALQLDMMRAMGVNTITFELRASDPTYIPGPFVPPVCNMGPSLGLQWPQPTVDELGNLVAFLDLSQNKGMRVWLRLPNTHMEEQPPTNSATWLGAILNAIKSHPALDLVLFEGDAHLIDTIGNGTLDSCGIPAEPPLYLGPTAYGAQYVKWAISFAQSLGMSPRKLSAEAIVGDYFTQSQAPAGPNATDRHLWDPIMVLKGIFDTLGVPNNLRTYALSIYSHRKCATARTLPCVDEDPHTWADETLQHVLATVGQANGARIVAPELGTNVPIQATWSAERAFESLSYLMAKYGVEGGAYWIWSEENPVREADPAYVGEPIKLRGLDFVYNPVQKEILAAYGFQLIAVANGSFETGGTTADSWTTGGAGTVTRFRLADEPGQPVLPTRGDYALRLVTGSGANDIVSATSAAIQVSPSTTYTTTGNLRFHWSGDPNVGISSPSRPQVYLTVHYMLANGAPSTVRTQDTFRFFQEDAATGFGTFPVAYSTPADANLIQLEFGAARNGLAQPITFDVDNVR